MLHLLPSSCYEWLLLQSESLLFYILTLKKHA